MVIFHSFLYVYQRVIAVSQMVTTPLSPLVTTGWSSFSSLQISWKHDFPESGDENWSHENPHYIPKIVSGYPSILYISLFPFDCIHNM